MRNPAVGVPILLAFLASSPGGAGSLQMGALPEFQVKARYMGILAEYVIWPAGSGAERRNFRIGVLGESPIQQYLGEVCAGRRIKNQKADIVSFKDLDSVADCDVLFIPESESHYIRRIVNQLRGKPVLTVGDTPDFARQGVMVNFYVDRDCVRFEVNRSSLKNSGLEMSSHVLKMARIVE